MTGYPKDTEEYLRQIYRGRPCLITGGLGFIGSNLAHILVKLGAKVTIVDSLIPAYGGNLFNISDIRDKVHINIADVRDPHSMNVLVQGMDFIFNMAGQVSHIDSMIDPTTDLDINCRSQLTILEALRHHNPTARIVFAGTRGQYGRARYLPVDEDHLTIPTDVNGINKVAGELYHLVYQSVYGIPACSIRMTNTYGPRHLMKNSRQGFLAWFVRLAIDGEEISIYGDGSQKRDFVYVDDVVRALVMLLADENTVGQVYNLGSMEPVSVRQIAEMVIEIAGSGSLRLIAWPEDKKAIEIGDYYSSYEKIKRDLAWKPTIDLREGLERTVSYYKEHKEHYW